jgi:hypothetical protein
MPTIRITEETIAAIRRAAIYDFHQTGSRQTDGTWLVEISDMLAERLAEVALSDVESDACRDEHHVVAHDFMVSPPQNVLPAGRGDVDEL